MRNKRQDTRSEMLEIRTERAGKCLFTLVSLTVVEGFTLMDADVIVSTHINEVHQFAVIFPEIDNPPFGFSSTHIIDVLSYL